MDKELEAHFSYLTRGVDEIKNVLGNLVARNGYQDTRIAVAEKDIANLKEESAKGDAQLREEFKDHQKDHDKPLNEHKKAHWAWVPVAGGIMAIIIGFMKLVKII